MTFGTGGRRGRSLYSPPVANPATSNRLLLAAGLVTWAIAATLSFGGSALWLWAVAFGAFGAAFATHVLTSPTQPQRLALLAVQSAAGITVLVGVPGDEAGFSGVLLAIVAGQLPFVLP